MTKTKWWCPVCMKNVPGAEVTFKEDHEICGTYIGDCQDITEEQMVEYAVALLVEKGLTPEQYEKAFNASST